MDEQNKESLPDFDELIEAEGNDAEAEAVDAPKGKTAVKNTPIQELYEWFEVFVLAIAAVILIFTFVFRIATVDGNSMNQTLIDGERLVVREAFYQPKQGDIIVCQSKSYGMEKPLVKRVIATGGQTVTIDFATWSVYVDGEKVEEDYVNYVGGSMHGWDHGSSYTVPNGYVFVMGDNRNDSMDSRRLSIGPIDERLILGKAVIGISERDGVRFFD